jgi:signal transduction histidine kinase
VVQKNMQLLETKEKLEQSVRHLKLLFELESTMGRASSQEELIRGVLQESAQTCEAAGGAVLLTEEEGGFELALWDAKRPTELGGETWRGLPGASLPPDGASIRGFLTTALQRRQPVQIGPGNDGGLALAGDARMNSALAVPLEWEDGAPMGAMALFNKTEGRPFAAEDVELLRIIAANFCTAVNLFRARVKRVREERLSTIGSLLSSVVHDLKGPMAVISGYVQMMSDVEDAARRKEYAGLILKQFESIAAMQREVLEFARGEKRLLVRKVYLGKFFEELAAELRADLGNPKVALDLDLSDRTTARFDQNKITRAVHNLVRNAVEAMGPRGGKVTLRIARGTPAGPSKKGDLVVEVSDTGPGIPKQIEGRLFESFVTAGKKGGTGLGLAIVKKIVNEHGGSVGVQSSPAGTTFTIVLPQDDAKS